MTRKELFNRYVEDTLDEQATAELEKLLGDDPEFAAKFAQELLETGLFVEVDGVLQRVGEQENEDATEGGSSVERPAKPKLLLGEDADGELPPSLQRLLGPGSARRHVPGQVAPLPPPAPPCRPPGSPSAEKPAAAHPPPPPAVASSPPPAPPSPPRSPRAPHDPVGLPGGALHRTQPVLKSSEQRSPVVAISIAILLLAGIGVALIIGLNREPPAPPETAGIIARVDALEGVVTLTRGIGQEKLPMGTDLFEGDIIKVEQGSLRIAFVGERTYLHIRSGSEIRFGEQEAGKQVRLSLGELTAEAAPQPAGQPMVVATTHARVLLRGTKVTVRAAAETLVEVAQGEVEVERRDDGATVGLNGGGTWTMVGDDQPLTAWEFVVGVNLNGEEVMVENRKWMSYAAAKLQGLEVEAIGKDVESRKSLQQPAGYLPGVEMGRMLMSNLTARGTQLAIRWPQPNGRYQVFVWIMEDAGTGVRSLRLNVEDVLVGEELGAEQAPGDWNRYGPYSGTVTDESLDLLVSAESKRQNPDPHLSGLAIYRAVGAGPSPPEGSPLEDSPSDPTAPPEPEPGVPPAIQPTIP